MSGALAINTITTHTPQVEAAVPEVREPILRAAGAFEEQGAQGEGTQERAFEERA